MTTQEKERIKELLTEFVNQFPSQAKAADRLKNVSEATVINILKNRHERVSEDMWRKTGRQVGWNPSGEWNLFHTYDFKTLITYFKDAQRYGNVFSITADAGAGKTSTANWFATHQSNVYHIHCAEYWNRKMFLRKILQAMGKNDSGYNTAELMDEIIENLIKQDSPLLILDEADKLTDHVLYFFITLYNLLEGKCGIVLLSTDYLNKRISRGTRFNKKGYKEIFSRLGRRFISLSGTTKKEIKAICEANGVNQNLFISEVYNEYEGDLRRVKRMVHKVNLKNG